MAETLLFNIPDPANGSVLPNDILWFQSTDGITWDLLPIDTTLTASLLIDVNTGKYIWGSLLADPTRYHQLKAEDALGNISVLSSIIPPRPQVSYNKPNQLITGVQLDNSTEVTYNLGDTIEFILKLDSTASNFDPTIPIKIIDEYENVIASLTGNQIGGTTYIASWTIPLNLIKLYNITSPDLTPRETLRLFDQWQFPDGTNVSYPFLTRTIVDSPQEENSILNINIDGLASIDGALTEPKIIKFSTRLTPYYATISDIIRGEYGALLEGIDPIDIATEIIFRSKSVDLHMKPDNIYYQDRYDQAVRSYVRVTTLRHFLTPLGITQGEEKMLDMFKISRTYGDPAGLIKEFDDQARQYAKFIWAGGKDTPFLPQLFSKGIFDPNRPNASRASLDTTGWYPWTNTTSSSTTITDANGNNIEIRGTRTTGYGFVFNKYAGGSNSIPDSGDAGYLSRI